MPNTLGLDDDLEPVEVVLHLERVFDITISDEEAERIFKVGEFHDLLLEKIPPNSADRKCASAMAFYRLRRAMRQLGYSDALLPGSSTRALELGRTRKNLKRLEKEAGLRMPKAASTKIGRLGSLCGFLATLIAVFAFQTSFMSVLLGILLGLAVAGIIYRHLDPGQLPANCETLGGLAKAAAIENYGHLIKMGARHKNEDIWETLTEALSQYGLQKSEISRETLFLQSQTEKHAST